LRLKLADYYNHDGINDTIVVEVPYGAYAVNFHDREAAPSPSRPIPVRTMSREPGRGTHEGLPQKEARRWFLAVAVLSLLLALALGAIVMLVLGRDPARTEKPKEGTPRAAVGAFWSAFVSSPSPPWVIFSNAAFVGRPETGMRYLDPVRDSHRLILDHYTGVGEVLAVHELDEVFDLLHHAIRVKRGSLFSLDDASDHNLIFVGSPAENLSLLDFPGTTDFVFTRRISNPHRGQLVIRNVKPAPGEPALYSPTDPSQPLEEDYSIVALIPGLSPLREVLILAGTTTLGTQAAVEYVCTPDSLQELMRSLGLSGGAPKPFEALLRVKVTRGVPVGIQLVSVRRHD
jgi:hypothetical protein